MFLTLLSPLFISSELDEIYTNTFTDQPNITEEPSLSLRDPKVFIPLIIAFGAMIAIIVAIVSCFKKHCVSCIPYALC